MLQEGITIVFGNNDDLELLAANACRCVELAGLSDVKVYKGASKPLVIFNLLMNNLNV